MSKVTTAEATPSPLRGLPDLVQPGLMAQVHPVEHTDRGRHGHGVGQLIAPIGQQFHRRLQRG